MNNDLSECFGNKSEGDFVLNEKMKEKITVENGIDYIIPDYVSDVESILFCSAVPKIDGKYINGNYVEIEGTLNIRILLATENNTLSSLSYSEPFDCKTAVEDLNEDCFICVEPSTEYVNARLVNPRKVNVRYQVNCNTKLYCSYKLSPEITGIQSIEDDMCLQRKYVTVKSADILSYEEKDINASQDIELDSNLPQVKQIVLCKVQLIPNDVKVKDGEAVIRSEAVVNCIYETVDDNYQNFEKKFNLEKTITGVTSNDCQWYARATVDKVKANAVSNSYGEMKTAELDFTYDLELYGTPNKEVSVVNDVYSTEYECESKRSKIAVTVFKRTYATNVTVNSFAPRGDIDAENVKSIFTGNIEIKNIDIKFDPAKSRIVAEGTAEISIVSENNVIVENEKLFGLHKYDYPFRCELDTADDLSSSEFVAEYYVSNVKYRADSNNLYADFEMNMRVNSLEKNEVEYIEAVKIDRNTHIIKDRSLLTLCYPGANESLWDIAKNYKITSSSISSVNGLPDDNIDGKKVLLIPRENHKNPVFSKII